MAKNENTSKDVASLASKLLKDPSKATQKDIKRLAGSVLTQAPDKSKGKSKGKWVRSRGGGHHSGDTLLRDLRSSSRGRFGGLALGGAGRLPDGGRGLALGI